MTEEVKELLQKKRSEIRFTPTAEPWIEQTMSWVTQFSLKTAKLTMENLKDQAVSFLMT